MSFLPDPLPFDGNWSKWTEVEERLHKQFCSDLLHKPLRFQNKLVKFDFTLDSEKEKTFWHLTTRDYQKTGNRNPEGQRALRIHWVRLVIENHSHADITYFTYPEPNSRLRHYFWVQSEEYVLILEEVKTAFILITAYVIDLPYMRANLQRKLDKSRA